MAFFFGARGSQVIQSPASGTFDGQVACADGQQLFTCTASEFVFSHLGCLLLARMITSIRLDQAAE